MRTHGKEPTYRHGCRCQACTEANRLGGLARRRKRGVRPAEQYRDELRAAASLRHGIRARYVKGCRCDACTAAEAAYRAEYRRRKAGAA